MSPEAWREVVMRDAQPPVLLNRLYSDPATKAFTTLVRFPAGWQRAQAGHYQAEEEVLFLAGPFEMSGETYNSRSYAYFPAGYLRNASTAPAGALALAWFSEPNKWSRGLSPASVSTPLVRPDWAMLPYGRPALATGNSGHLLRADESGDTWILKESPTGLAPADAVVELFSLDEHTWARVLPGERLPFLRAPVFCRFRVGPG